MYSQLCINSLVFLPVASVYCCYQIFLGGFPLRWYAEEEATYAEKNFLSDLEKLEAEFNERDKSMDVPYKCMMPSRVPNNTIL